MLTRLKLAFDLCFFTRLLPPRGGPMSPIPMYPSYNDICHDDVALALLPCMCHALYVLLRLPYYPNGLLSSSSLLARTSKVSRAINDDSTTMISVDAYYR